MGGTGGGYDFLIGGIGAPEGDILPHRAAAEPGFLQDHAPRAAQRVPRQVADVVPADRHRPAVHIVEPHEQVDDGGLAATGRSDDGNALPVLHRQREVPDQLAVGRIGERYAIQFHTAVYIGGGQPDRVRRIRLLRRRLDQLKQAGGTRQRVLQLRDDAGNLVEGLGILAGVGQEAGQHTDGQRHAADRVQADQSSEQRGAGIHQIVDKAGKGIGQGGVEGRAAGYGLQPPVDFIKIRYRLVLVRKGGDYLVTADQLVHKGGLLGADTGLLGKQHAGAPRHKGRNKQRQRRYQHNPRRHKRIDGQHEHQRSEYGQDAGEQLGKPDEQSVRDLIRIGYDTADNIPHRTTVEIGQRKPLQMDKGILPQAAHHTERNMVVDDVHQPLAHRRHQNDDTGSQQNAGQPAVRIDLTLTDQQINGTSGQDG